MAFTGKKAQEWIKPAVVIGGVFLLWRYGAKPVLESLGLKDSAEDQLRQKVENSAGNKDYWRPNWFSLPANQFPVYGATGVVLLKEAVAKEYALQLRFATYGPGTDEEKIYGVFRNLKYKSQVSFLAYWFYQQYKTDLYQVLRDDLNDSELATVLQITQKLPWGIITSTGIKGHGRGK